MSYISQEGLEKLKEELRERTTARRREIGRQMEEAKALGDLSENAEYQNAVDLRSVNEARIMELQDIINAAELIKPGKSGKREVEIGTVVEVELMGPIPKGLAKKQTLAIVGSQEANPALGKISNESPLGRAFLGHRVGDKVDVETPKGKMRYRIKTIK